MARKVPYHIGKHWRWAIWVSLGIMALSSIPYIAGYAAAPPGYRFTGFIHSFTDCMVYLSWIGQAADGHFFLRNLFTSEQQVGLGFNLLFFSLGTISAILHVSPVLVYHVARFAAGFALLLAVYGLAGRFAKDLRERRLCLLLVGLSAGLGWAFPRLWASQRGIEKPTDLWQAESTTFLSAYWSPNFSVPLLLMVGILYLLYRFGAVRAWKYPVGAGVLLALLANIHTYDVITLAIVWTAYSVYRLTRRPGDARPLIGGAIAGLIASPMVAYQVYYYLNEPVFRERASVPTLSPNPVWYLIGYGLLIPLAILGIRYSSKQRRDVSLLVCWAAATLVAAYLPVAFQRKLVMGAHIPLAMLAALGLAFVTGSLRPRLRAICLGLAVLLLIPSNAVFLGGDIGRLLRDPDLPRSPFLSEQQIGVLQYLRSHASLSDVVLTPAEAPFEQEGGVAVALPDLPILIPGYAGVPVYWGHWGETTDYYRKKEEARLFFDSGTSSDARAAFLAREGIGYVIEYSGARYADLGFVDFGAETLPFLKPVFSVEGFSVYKVTL